MFVPGAEFFQVSLTPGGPWAMSRMHRLLLIAHAPPGVGHAGRSRIGLKVKKFSREPGDVQWFVPLAGPKGV